MIQFVEMECPNCGGDLTKTGEATAKCSHCGAEFLIDKGQPERVTNIYQTPSAPARKSGAITFLTITVIFFIVIFAALASSDRKSGSYFTAPQEAAEPEAVYSNFFAFFSHEVYHCEPAQVTEKQLAAVTYLRIHSGNSGITLEYALDNGEVKTLALPSEANHYYDDITRFTGLQSLDLPQLGLSETEFSALTELTEIRSCNSPDQLASLIVHPEQITTLVSYSADSLAGIDAFSNLEHLSVKCDSELSDLGALSALKNLKSLTIQNGDSITDFAMLQSLSALEELSIDSEGLKDISFLQHLTDLKKLALEDTVLLDISPIGNLTALTELSLEDNNEVTDYSCLSSLNSLEALTLDLGTNAAMPSVENWNNLTSLSISGADSLHFLSLLPTLHSLSISGSSSTDYSAISSLQNLENLCLRSIFTNITNLDFLSSLTNLKSLDISSLKVYGQADAAFSLPNLECLNMNDCSFELNFDVLTENTNLKQLYLNRIELWDNVYVESDGFISNIYYDNVNLDDKISFLEKFPNLEELYLQSNKLTGIEFTASLLQLKKLDITDNYITDLRPLAQLQQLDTVWCGENSISHGLDLGEDVTVISDSKSNKRF